MAQRHPTDAFLDHIIGCYVNEDKHDTGGPTRSLAGLNMYLEDGDMMRAAEQGNPNVAEEMREAIASIQETSALAHQIVAAQDQGDTAKTRALRAQLCEIMDLPLPPVIPQLPAPYEAIDEAIEKGDVPTLRALLADSPELNVHLGACDGFPLQWAMMAKGRSVAVVQALVEHGADVRFATPDGYTALHHIVHELTRPEMAPATADLAMAQLLVAHGADIEARNHEGCTPLHCAVVHGSRNDVAALLTVGANPNARFGTTEQMHDFARGYTLLRYAVNWPDLVQLLLEHGADPAGISDDGKTALSQIDEWLEQQKKAYGGGHPGGLLQSRSLIEEAMRR